MSDEALLRALDNQLNGYVNPLSVEEDLVDKFKAKRIKLEYSTTDLAWKLGVTRKTLSRWENKYIPFPTIYYKALLAIENNPDLNTSRSMSELQLLYKNNILSCLEIATREEISEEMERSWSRITNLMRPSRLFVGVYYLVSEYTKQTLDRKHKRRDFLFL